MAGLLHKARVLTRELRLDLPIFRQPGPEFSTRTSRALQRLAPKRSLVEE